MESSSKPIRPCRHPFQEDNPSAIQGSVSCCRVQGGLYVRMDFPGVPTKEVLIEPQPHVRSFKITAMAPDDKHAWGKYPTSRSYELHLEMNSDIARIHYEKSMERGSLRLFFPDVPESYADKQIQIDGILHLPPHVAVPGAGGGGSSSESPIISLGTLKKYALVIEPNTGPVLKCEAVSSLENWHDIISYRKGGLNGICELQLKQYSSKWRIYLRIDMPGVPDGCYILCTEEKQLTLVAGSTKKEFHLDAGCGRKYTAIVRIRCRCCSFVKDQDKKVNKVALTNGVFRYITLLSTDKDLPHNLDEATRRV